MRLALHHKLFLLLLLAIALVGVMAYVSGTAWSIHLFNGLLVVSGLWLLLWVTGRMWLSLRSYRWPSCVYTVQETKVIYQAQTGENISHRYLPFFQLQYSFKGKSYTRTSEDDLNLHLQQHFHTPHDANRYVNEVSDYRYGKKLFVNPHNPEVAFLRRGLTRDQMGMLLFSLILIVMPVLTLLGWIEWQSHTHLPLN